MDGGEVDESKDEQSSYAGKIPGLETASAVQRGWPGYHTGIAIPPHAGRHN